MQGKWIWNLLDNISENQVVCFCKEFSITTMDQPVQLRMSADTRYVVLINGTEVGRGPIRSVPEKWYFDEYDISFQLTQGRNLIAVRVWNYGFSTYQSLASQGGLVFDIVQGDKLIACSDKNMRAKVDDGWKQYTVKRNVNLGFMENYDSRDFAQNWVSELQVSSNWPRAHEIKDIWGKLNPSPVSNFTVEEHRPVRLCKYSETKHTGQQVSINTRSAFFPRRRDANQSLFSGFIGVVIESLVAAVGKISFPNRTWNGIIGTFSINGKVYEVSNENREIPVVLIQGKQLFLMQISGKFDDLFCHIEFIFDEKLWFSGIGDLGGSFFVIGPTSCVVENIDGTAPVFGGLNEFNRMETHTNHHDQIFACQNEEDLLGFKDEIIFIDEKYVFHNEYIYSLMRMDKVVIEYAIQNDMNGMLWNNGTPTRLPTPKVGEYNQLIVDLGDIYVGALEFSLYAGQGMILDLYCFENMFEGDIDFTVGLNNSVRYICKEGLQTYRTMSRIGCRFIAITLRNQMSDINLYGLKIRNSSYPVSCNGTFACSDDSLNKIWAMSRQTHTLCREDCFTDCPTYEQVFWIGDSYSSSLVNMYLYGEYELIRHSLHLATTAFRNGPMMNALAPTDWNTSIPVWMMNWILAIEQYMIHSGDREILAELYPDIQKVLRYYAKFITSDGAFLVNAWNMLDWAALDIYNHCVVTGQQALLAYCYRICAGYARDLNFEDDAVLFEDLDRKMLRYIDKNLWSKEKNAFMDGWSPEHGPSKTVSIQTHTLLVLFDGVLDSHKRELAESYTINTPDSFVQVGSPFILCYLYDLLARLGRIQAVLDDIKNRWGMMSRYDCTTCWEVFPGFYEIGRTRSYCHSWSSTPAYITGRYLLGVNLMEAGFSKIKICIPEVDLQWCAGSIPTLQGTIQVYWSKENGIKKYKIITPASIQVAFDADSDWQIVIETKE